MVVLQNFFLLEAQFLLWCHHSRLFVSLSLSVWNLFKFWRFYYWTLSAKRVCPLQPRFSVSCLRWRRTIAFQDWIYSRQPEGFFLLRCRFMALCLIGFVGLTIDLSHLRRTIRFRDFSPGSKESLIFCVQMSNSCKLHIQTLVSEIALFYLEKLCFTCLFGKPLRGDVICNFHGDCEIEVYIEFEVLKRLLSRT